MQKNRTAGTVSSTGTGLTAPHSFSVSTVQHSSSSYLFIPHSRTTKILPSKIFHQNSLCIPCVPNPHDRAKRSDPQGRYLGVDVGTLQPTISIFTVDVNFNPEDGGWKFFRNVGKYRSDCTVSRPTRQQFSQPTPSSS
jgi:hypothetical protein